MGKFSTFSCFVYSNFSCNINRSYIIYTYITSWDSTQEYKSMFNRRTMKWWNSFHFVFSLAHTIDCISFGGWFIMLLFIMHSLIIHILIILHGTLNHIFHFWDVLIIKVKIYFKLENYKQLEIKFIFLVLYPNYN